MDGRLDAAVSEGIRIDPAIAGDESTLAVLCSLVQEMHARERPDFFKRVNLSALDMWFSDALGNAAFKIWLARVDGTPAGYAVVTEQRRDDNVFGHSRRWYEVEQVGVRPEFQRRGIARALLARASESAAAEGISEIELTTWHFNEAARESFERCGFVVKSVRLERPVKAV